MAKVRRGWRACRQCRVMKKRCDLADRDGQACTNCVVRGIGNECCGQDAATRQGLAKASLFSPNGNGVPSAVYGSETVSVHTFSASLLQMATSIFLEHNVYGPLMRPILSLGDGSAGLPIDDDNDGLRMLCLCLILQSNADIVETDPGLSLAVEGVVDDVEATQAAAYAAACGRVLSFTSQTKTLYAEMLKLLYLLGEGLHTQAWACAHAGLALARLLQFDTSTSPHAECVWALLSGSYLLLRTVLRESECVVSVEALKKYTLPYLTTRVGFELAVEMSLDIHAGILGLPKAETEAHNATRYFTAWREEVLLREPSFFDTHAVTWLKALGLETLYLRHDEPLLLESVVQMTQRFNHLLENDPAVLAYAPPSACRPLVQVIAVMCHKFIYDRQHNLEPPHVSKLALREAAGRARKMIGRVCAYNKMAVEAHNIITITSMMTQQLKFTRRHPHLAGRLFARTKALQKRFALYDSTIVQGVDFTDVMDFFAARDYGSLHVDSLLDFLLD